MAVEVGIGLALLYGLAPGLAQRVAVPVLAVIAVPEPPSEPPPPPKRLAPQPAARAAPPARPQTAPVVPPPVVPSPAEVPVVTLATPVLPAAGPASGVAGEGDGSGAGGEGEGVGGGGTHAVYLRGRIRDSDYPRDAVSEGAQGGLEARYVIGTDGRVKACTVTRSSGSRPLDETTCRLVKERFRFRPARDGAGRKVEDVIYEEHRWVIEN